MLRRVWLYISLNNPVTRYRIWRNTQKAAVEWEKKYLEQWQRDNPDMDAKVLKGMADSQRRWGDRWTAVKWIFLRRFPK
jgi:hypothetical protein